MAKYGAEGRWKCDAPGCNAVATHQYFWLGRPTVCCVLHMETAVELARRINNREVEETLKPLPPEKRLAEFLK